MRRLDALFAGLLAERTAETTVVMTSDHGNFEDSTVKTHTRAPVPLLAIGAAAPRFADLESILEVGSTVLDVLAGASS